MIVKAVALIDFVWTEQYKRFTLTPGRDSVPKVLIG